MAERPKLGLDDLDDDSVDIAELGQTKVNKPKVSRQELSKVSESAGFVSRQAARPRRRRGTMTAYTQQKNIKMRPGMNDLFADVADDLGVKDYELFEMAFLALLTKQKLRDEQARFKEITT